MAQMRAFSNAIVCVSDVHLELDAPERLALFRRFLLEVVLHQAKALYILGDLFTAWPGDEFMAHAGFHPLLEAFQTLANSHIPVFILHGNHDFLLGHEWCQQSGMIPIHDGELLEWCGEHWYLLHGDVLCIEDTAYQAFRTMVRNPEWQQGFLSLPLNARLQEIEKVRGRSEEEKTLKSEGIMDVNRDAVLNVFRSYPDIAGMIHGHTHRPAEHGYLVENKTYCRWVLSDWVRQPGFGVLAENGCRFSVSYG